MNTVVMLHANGRTPGGTLQSMTALTGACTTNANISPKRNNDANVKKFLATKDASMQGPP